MGWLDGGGDGTAQVIDIGAKIGGGCTDLYPVTDGKVDPHTVLKGRNCCFPLLMVSSSFAGVLTKLVDQVRVIILPLWCIPPPDVDLGSCLGIAVKKKFLSFGCRGP